MPLFGHHEYILEAPRTNQEGQDEVVYLIKRPPLNVRGRENSAAIFRAWDEWWQSSLWAQNLSNANPRWNASNRSAPVYNSFWEEARLVNGHPHV